MIIFKSDDECRTICVCLYIYRVWMCVHTIRCAMCEQVGAGSEVFLAEWRLLFWDDKCEEL